MDCLPNTPIGISAGWDFEGQVIEDFHNAPILLYTDGLNEAENVAHDEFGNERLLAVLSEHPYTDANSLIHTLRKAVAAHVGTAEASDDLTMLCLKFH